MFLFCFAVVVPRLQLKGLRTRKNWHGQKQATRILKQLSKPRMLRRSIWRTTRCVWNRKSINSDLLWTSTEPPTVRSTKPNVDCIFLNQTIRIFNCAFCSLQTTSNETSFPYSNRPMMPFLSMVTSCHDF